MCGCRLLCATERALNAYAAANDRIALPDCAARCTGRWMSNLSHTSGLLWVSLRS